MERSRHVSPRFGVVTTLSLVLATVSVALLWQTPAAASPRSFAGIGGLLGIVGGSCWILTGMRSAVVRFLTRLVVAAAGSYALFCLSRNDEWFSADLIRYGINVVGLLISQTTIFLVLRTPVWRLGWPNQAIEPMRFTVQEIMILTSCVAVLLGMAVRYDPPKPMVQYWGGLIGIWILLPMASAGIVTGVLDRVTSLRLMGIVVALSLAAVGSVALGLAEERIASSSTSKIEWRGAAAAYGMIVSASLAVTAIVSIAGRIDGVASDPQSGLQQHGPARDQ